MEIVKMGRLLARCTNWMRLSRGSAGWVMMALLLALLGLLVIQTINWPGQEGGSFVPTWRDMTGRINRNQISPQGISDRGKIKSRQDDDDGEIVYQSDYPVSSDVFVSLLEAAASYLHHEQLKVANGWQRQISSLGGTDSTSAKVAADWRGYSRSLWEDNAPTSGRAPARLLAWDPRQPGRDHTEQQGRDPWSHSASHGGPRRPPPLWSEIIIIIEIILPPTVVSPIVLQL